MGCQTEQTLLSPALLVSLSVALVSCSDISASVRVQALIPTCAGVAFSPRRVLSRQPWAALLSETLGGRALLSLQSVSNLKAAFAKPLNARAHTRSPRFRFYLVHGFSVFHHVSRGIARAGGEARR